MGSGRLPTILSAGAAQAAGGSGARGAPAFVSFNSSGLGGVGASCCFIPFLFFPFFFLPFFQTHFFFFLSLLSPPLFPPFFLPASATGSGGVRARGAALAPRGRTGAVPG